MARHRSEPGATQANSSEPVPKEIESTAPIDHTKPNDTNRDAHTSKEDLNEDPNLDTNARNIKDEVANDQEDVDLKKPQSPMSRSPSPKRSRSPSRSRTPPHTFRRGQDDERRSASPARSRSYSYSRSRSPYSRSRSYSPRRSRRYSRDRSYSRSPSYSRSRSHSPSYTPRSHSYSRSRSYSRSPRSSRYRSYSPSPERRRKQSRGDKSSSPYGKIVIDNVTADIREDHIREIFGGYGRIESVWFSRPNPKIKMLKKLEGYSCYVIFKFPEEANRAEASMDGGMIDGKTVFVRSLAGPKTLSPPPRKPRSRGGNNRNTRRGRAAASSKPKRERRSRKKRAVDTYRPSKRGRSESPEDRRSKRYRDYSPSPNRGDSPGYNRRSYERSRSRSYTPPPRRSSNV